MAFYEHDIERRHKLLTALSTAPTVSEAARLAGWQRTYVVQLLREDDGFRADVEAARQKAGVGPLPKRGERPGRRSSGEADDPDERLALRVLREVAKDKDAGAGARVQAARELRVAAADRRKHLAPAAPAAPPAPLVPDAARQAAALADAQAFLAAPTLKVLA
jgi:hypothetical protein